MSKQGGLDAYVVKENFLIGPGRQAQIGGVVFVGDGPPAPGLLCISVQEFRNAPAGYLEPALDVDIQDAAKHQADTALKKVQARVDDAAKVVKAAEAELDAMVKRQRLQIQHSKFQHGLALKDLEEEQARHTATMAAFGVVVESGEVGPPEAEEPEQGEAEEPDTSEPSKTSKKRRRR